MSATSGPCSGVCARQCALGGAQAVRALRHLGLGDPRLSEQRRGPSARRRGLREARFGGKQSRVRHLHRQLRIRCALRSHRAIPGRRSEQHPHRLVVDRADRAAPRQHLPDFGQSRHGAGPTEHDGPRAANPRFP
jgi:hypothetical protein